MKNISSNNYPRKLNKLTTGSLVMQIVKDISIFLPSVFTFATSLFVRHGIEREIQACRDAGRQARRITQIERDCCRHKKSRVTRRTQRKIQGLTHTKKDSREADR